MTGEGATGGGRRRNTGSAPRHSAARLAAVQALYQIELAGAHPDAVLEEFLRHRLGEPVEEGGEGEGDGDAAPVRPTRALFAELVRGVMARRAELDEMIAAALVERWSFDRLEVVLRAILRLGAYELAQRPRVPARAVISEYIDAAHAFFSGQEPRLVNGILDRLARSLRPAEFAGRGPAEPPG